MRRTTVKQKSKKSQLIDKYYENAASNVHIGGNNEFQSTMFVPNSQRKTITDTTNSSAHNYKKFVTGNKVGKHDRRPSLKGY